MHWTALDGEPHDEVTCAAGVHPTTEQTPPVNEGLK